MLWGNKQFTASEHHIAVMYSNIGIPVYSIQLKHNPHYDKQNETTYDTHIKSPTHKDQDTNDLHTTKCSVHNGTKW